jgi:sterol 3beta-glucosyltransferase
MDAALLTYGSRGDIEPFVALACSLRQRGHRVVLACPAALRGLADDQGVPVLPLPGNPDQLVRQLMDAGRSLPGMVRSVSRFVLPLGAQVLRAVLEGIPRADVVVHSFLMTQAGHALARELGVPQASAQLFPMFAATRSFPAPALPDLPLGPGYRWLSHRLTEQVFRRGGDTLYARLRRIDPGLPEIEGWPFSGPTATPILMAFSPTIVPRPADWPPHVHVTGYWFSPPRECQPERDLLSFLEAGPPPIYVGFGSSAPLDSRLAAEIVKAISRLGVRALLDSHWGDLWPHELPVGHRLIGPVPHAWLLPRVSVAVHHAGAGTTGAVLRAGIPSVVLPFASDQPFWARRLMQLGVAPPPISPRRLSAEDLTNSLRCALQDVSMRVRAKQVGESVRKEDGVGNTVTQLESLAAEHVRHRNRHGSSPPAPPSP